MKLTPHTSLPADTVTRTIAILAQKGAGKTYTAMKMAELLLREAQQVVALDPTGVWWGLRADTAGKAKAGLDVLIMGGTHGDVPLEPSAGELIAEFVVESGRSLVLDLSHFESNAEQNRFVTAFAEKLYRLKAHSRTPLHLMLDEADSFAPQRPQPGEQRMLGAFESIVRRGRSRGLGMTMISQRPACLNKNVLTQVDALICHRVTGKQDMDALTDWIKHWQTEKNQTAEFLASLPSLDVGECWFWSPGWTGTFRRGKVLARTTYDSSRTPEPGAALPQVQVKAVDISALSAQILATVERAKANDPAELKREIAKLKKELAAQPAAVEKSVEVPVLTREDRAHLECLHNQLHAISFQSVLVVLEKIQAHLTAKPLVQTKTASNGMIVERVPKAAHPVPASHKTTASAVNVTKCERAILTVLAQFSHSGPCSKRKIACIAGYSITGGGFNNSLSALRGEGRITGGDPITITAAGIEALGSYTPLPEGVEAIEFWIRELSKCEGAILRALLDAGPMSHLTKAEIAERAGYEVTGGGFNNSLSALRTRELIEGKDQITLLIP